MTTAPPQAAAPVPVVVDEDVGHAWEKPEAPPPVPAVVPTRRPDPRQPFRDVFAKAEASLTNGQLPAAASAADEAVALSQRLTGIERLQAHKLRWVVAGQQGLPPQAMAESWFQACGPQQLDTCRLEAASALAKAGAGERLETEHCIGRSERAKKADPCERKLKNLDDVGRLRLAWAHALAEKGPKQLAAMQRVAKTAVRPAGLSVRQRALAWLARDAQTKGDIEMATTRALAESAVVESMAGEAEKRYGRSELLDATCVAYDAKRGLGACRKLEMSRLQHLTFTDFSARRAGMGLDETTVKTVNAHFAPLLDPCLMAEAQRLTPPDSSRYNVRWTVANDGRVAAVELPKEGPTHPLAKCLGEQFEQWRYPSYDGELQHVEQSFTVTAVRRR